MALVVLGLSIFAVAQLIRIISLKMFCPCKNDRMMTVIPIDSSTTDAETFAQERTDKNALAGNKK